jgi:hypothetical protein
MKRLPRTSTLAVAAALASGCGGDPLAPPAAALPPVEVPLGLSSEDDGGLQVALLFAGQETVRGLKERGLAGRVAAAFISLAGRIEAKDRAGTGRAMATARLAISRYRDEAHDGAAAADLEALDLTLARAAALTIDITDKERP